MTKLIIQIPCFNEEESLPLTLRELPRQVLGVSKVEWLVIDDGSTDRTVEVARAAGVDYVIRHRRNLGLASAFITGLSACLERDADIIVTTDADNQYCADDIPSLIEPILSDRADMVIGTRPVKDIPHFGMLKKALQLLGSWTVRQVSQVEVEDAPSGFRAMSRQTALKLNVFSSYSYTLETIIQAGYKGFAVECVPVSVNEDLRTSRLVKGIPSYISSSILIMGRIVVTYRPFRFFMMFGLILLMIGLLLGIRFMILFAMGEGKGHVKSLILMAVITLTGFQMCVLGVLADIISVNRKLLEDIKYTVWRFLLRNRE